MNSMLQAGSWRSGTSSSASSGRAAVVCVTHSSIDVASDVVCRLRTLDFDARLWDESHVASGGAPSFDFVVADRAGLRMIARSLGRSSDERAHEPPCRGGLAPGALQRVLAQIEARLPGKIEIVDLALTAGLSECHFTRAFRQSVGMPPHRYLVTRRIAIGAGLIERTALSITEVALEAGFSDHSHFTRMFVRMIGETPSAYRWRHR